MTHTRHLLPTLLVILAAACSQQAEPESESLAVIAPPLPPAYGIPLFAPPYAHDDQYTLDEDGSILADVLANDAQTQLATAPSSIAIATAPEHGTAVPNAAGFVQYTPDADYNGSDSFQYTVDNIAGQTSNTATCLITVNAVCDAPVAVNDSVTTDTNGAVAIAFRANDSDPDGPVQVASFQFLSSPVGGVGTYDPATQTIIYLANAGFEGVDTFSCQYTDNCGADSNPFDVTVHVIVMDPPSNLSYSDNPVVYDEGLEITPNLPSYDGDLADSFTVTPALPAGLSLDPTTGVISGAPLANPLPAPSHYSVIASNQAGASLPCDVLIGFTEAADAPTDLSYSSDPAIYVVGFEISPNLPSYTGVATGWSVSPALPAGLMLDALTGVISGTPTVESDASPYDITASNSQGGDPVTLTISVELPPPPPSDLSYSDNPVHYDEGVAISPNIPSYTGVVDLFSVDPPLDSLGLSLDPLTGVITGTPLIPTDGWQAFEVTAENISDEISQRVLINVHAATVGPSDLSYSENPAFYLTGQEITPNIPTVTGGVTSFTASPALPAGLLLDPITGVISGTPSETSSLAPYTITASNSLNSDQEIIAIEVADQEPPSNLSYPTNPGIYQTDFEIAPNIPTVTGSVESFTSTPALPSGLILNPLTGVISGTPTAETPLTGYLITATNSGGIDTESLTIEITEGPGNTAGSAGSYQSSTGPDIPGPFFVDSNYRGASNSLQIVRISWGRLVDIADITGTVRHRDFVINDGIQSNGSYDVATNPITDKTTVTINDVFDSESYVEALDALDDSLGTIFDKSLDVTELPPFPLMPRNAALMIQFNDLLDIRYEDGDWEDNSQGLLVASSGQLSPDIIRVLTGYMPTTPFEARIIASPNYGDLAHYNGNPGQEFHTTRVILDMTISELDAAISDPPLAVNSIGLPASTLGVTDANLGLRLATQADPLSGQAVVLTNPTGHALDFFENGSNDSSTSTQDIVRAMRTGSSTDANNGFLGDSLAPQIIGSLTVDLEGAVIEVGNPGDGLYEINLTRFTPPACAPGSLKFGTDILVQQGVRAIVMSGVQAGPTVYNLTVQVISPVDGVIQLGDAQIQTPYDSVTDVPGCFLRFSPNAGSPPTFDVSKNAHILVRFSEPMDPASLQPFDNMTLTRLDIEDPNLQPFDYAVGSVQASGDLKEFSFVPSMPLERSPTTDYQLAIAGGDAVPTDLAGNPLNIGAPFKVDFGLTSAESVSISRGFALRFAEVNQLVFNTDDESNNWPEFRDSQLIYDLNAEEIRPRPVTHYSVAADRDKPIPAVMTPFPAGVQTPLSPLGSKLHTLWRYCDLGFSLTDETNMNIDVEGLAWAPAGGSIVSDAYDEFEVRVAHSGWLPDELLDPNSGFPLHPQSGLNTVYSTNYMDPSEDPGKVIHSREKGYVVNPGDLFIGQGNGSNMLPFPVNKNVPLHEYTYYTWRDTALEGTGGNNGAGAILDIEDSILFGGAGTQKTYTAGNVPSIGLPLLMEFRCYVDTGALGLNAFDISLAVNSSARPNFRAFSTGGYNSNSDPVFKDPDLEDAADGGYNPGSNPPGAATPGVDNSFYIGQVDLVTRVSRSHSIWFNTELTNPSYQDPVMDPAPEHQPAGTEIVIAYRGSTITGIGPADTDTVLTNPANIDLYGAKQGGNGSINFLNGDSSWKESISEINSAQFFQLRMTFISNAATNQTPHLSSLGLAYGE